MNRQLLSRVLQVVEQFPDWYDPRCYREEHSDGSVTFDLSGLVALVEGATWCTDGPVDAYVVGDSGEPVAVERWAAERLGLDAEASEVLRLCDDDRALQFFSQLART